MPLGIIFGLCLEMLPGKRGDRFRCLALPPGLLIPIRRDFSQVRLRGAAEGGRGIPGLRPAQAPASAGRPALLLINDPAARAARPDRAPPRRERPAPATAKRGPRLRRLRREIPPPPPSERRRRPRRP